MKTTALRFTRISRSGKGLPDICGRARAAGVTSELITDNDILKMHERATATVDALRSGYATGPFFFECQTYRWKEHVGPNEDFKLGYRTKEQAQPWIDNDQVERLAALLPARRVAQRSNPRSMRRLRKRSPSRKRVRSRNSPN